MLLCGCRAAVYVHGVADGLEQNKGNAKGQQAVYRSKLPVRVQGRQDLVDVLQQEIRIFAVTKQPQVTKYRENHKAFCRAGTSGGSGSGKQKAAAVGKQDDRSEQEQIAAVRTGIEKAAGGQKPQVTDSGRQQEVNDIDDRKKQ